MQELYEHCHISKQAHYKALAQERQWVEKEHLMVGLMAEIRQIHPAMGLRTMYEFYRPQDIGRDAFVSIGLQHGFRVKSFKNQTRTTFSSPFSRYPNRCVDLTINDINQLWSTDLTYFEIAQNFYYIVFLMDTVRRRGLFS